MRNLILAEGCTNTLGLIPVDSPFFQPSFFSNTSHFFQDVWWLSGKKDPRKEWGSYPRKEWGSYPRNHASHSEESGKRTEYKLLTSLAHCTCPMHKTLTPAFAFWEWQAPRVAHVHQACPLPSTYWWENCEGPHFLSEPTLGYHNLNMLPWSTYLCRVPAANPSLKLLCGTPPLPRLSPFQVAKRAILLAEEQLELPLG